MSVQTVDHFFNPSSKDFIHDPVAIRFITILILWWTIDFFSELVRKWSENRVDHREYNDVSEIIQRGFTVKETFVNARPLFSLKSSNAFSYI